ncbi:hypothetical protein SASPL_117700 [Salvia splendens]|uniref:CCR4-NOT transcription complex subunit 10 n=1 Tax=Salvia splendens TaxID=180675 RepID=A0A8X8ZYF6_SALSN|nr:hypothetical protein SASPL_117700 [Salvia splendens]
MDANDNEEDDSLRLMRIEEDLKLDLICIDNGISLQQQSTLASKSPPSNSITVDSSHPDSVVNANMPDNSLSMTLCEEALEDESLHQGEESLSVVDLRLKVHLYKVRLLRLTRNLRTAKRELKMAMNLAHGKDYPMALYLKSQLEYAFRNPRKAIKLLMASSNRTEIGISSMYYNNLGCMYYQLGKHHTSGVFFSKALKNSSLVQKEESIKLLNLGPDKSHLILYNSGMHSLACGRPLHAARRFQKASKIFYNRPLLWLRISECCLMALEKGLIKPKISAVDRSDIKVNVIGKGDGKEPELSLSLACQCLVNALYLLDSHEGKCSRSSLAPSTEQNELGETFSRGTNHKNGSGGNQKESNVPSGSSTVNSNGGSKRRKARGSYSSFENVCMYVSSGNNIELPYSCEKWTADKLIDSEDTNGGEEVACNGVSAPAR